MTQESLLTILVVTGAWVVLELLKYVFARTLAAATKNKRKGGNPGNSVMTAGELRGHFTDVKDLLGKVLDATNETRTCTKRTFDEVKR
jgi:hypothetical protein